MTDDLYSNAVLRLAAEIPRIGRLAHPQASVRKVSRLCGSEIELDVVVQSGRVADLALRVKACALGQASAAILARAGIGASLRELELARDTLTGMLKKSGPAPRGRFAELQLLQSARAYPARHQSILLAFDAAVEAVTNASATRTATPLTG
jgi:NifU-like protein involved in Fe-S cluster formation